MSSLEKPRHVIQLGNVVHVSLEERLELEELSKEMTRAAHYARPGWLWRYVQLQTQINKRIRRMVARSHGAPESASNERSGNGEGAGSSGDRSSLLGGGG